LVGKWLAGLAKPAPPILWHEAQLLTMPVWLKPAPKNEVVEEWQVSHPALVSTCVAGLNNGVTPAKDAPLWQLAHPFATPVWFIVAPVKLTVFL